MDDLTPIQGELQQQLMQAVWRSGAGTVEQIRMALPARYRGAYNTVQTVLNRLSERGLLVKVKQGNAFRYAPTMSEAEYLSRTMRFTLAGASSEARSDALATLFGELDRTELSELQKRAKRISKEGRS